MAARRGRGNTAVTYNGIDGNMTNYCNSAELSMAVDRLEATHFGSTAAETIAGDTTYSISLAGDWDVALDGILAPEAITTGTKRTAKLVYTGGSQTVTYAWTSLAEIQDYTISSGASDKITFTANLVLAGAPTRTAT